MVAVIEDGGHARGMMDRMRELEAHQNEIAERLAAVPADIPDIHPNIAIVYRRKVERLAEALADPRDRDEAAGAIRGQIERIVLTPGEKRGPMDAALHGDLGTILEWAGSGAGKRATDTPRPGMSVSVVAGGGGGGRRLMPERAMVRMAFRAGVFGHRRRYRQSPQIDFPFRRISGRGSGLRCFASVAPRRRQSGYSPDTSRSDGNAGSNRCAVSRRRSFQTSR